MTHARHHTPSDEDSPANSIRLSLKKIRKINKKITETQKEIKDELSFLPSTNDSHGKFTKLFKKTMDIFQEMPDIQTRVENAQLRLNQELNFLNKQKQDQIDANNHLQKQFSTQSKRTEELRIECTELRDHIQSRDSRIHDLQKIEKQLNERIENIQRYQDELLEYKKKYEAMGDSTKIIKENESLKKRVDHFKQKSENLHKKNQELHQQIIHTKEQTDSEIQSLRNSLHSTKSKLDQKSASFDKQVESFNNLRKKYQIATSNENSAQRELSKLKSEIQSLKSNFEQLSKENDSLNQKITEKEQAHTTDRNNFEQNLKRMEQEHKLTVEQLETKNKEALDQLNQERQNSENLNQQIESYKDLLANSTFSNQEQEVQFFHPAILDPSQSTDESKDFLGFQAQLSKVVEIFQLIDFFDINKPDALKIRERFLLDLMMDSSSHSFAGITDFYAFDHFSKVVKGVYSESIDTAVPVALNYFEKLFIESNEEVCMGQTFRELSEQILELSTSLVYFTQLKDHPLLYNNMELKKRRVDKNKGKPKRAQRNKKQNRSAHESNGNITMTPTNNTERMSNVSNTSINHSSQTPAKSVEPTKTITSESTKKNTSESSKSSNPSSPPQATVPEKRQKKFNTSTKQESQNPAYVGVDEIEMIHEVKPSPQTPNSTTSGGETPHKTGRRRSNNQRRYRRGSRKLSQTNTQQ